MKGVLYPASRPEPKAMWWEYVIVAVVVGISIAAVARHMRKTFRGEATCDCDCHDTCPHLESLEQELHSAVDPNDEPPVQRPSDHPERGPSGDETS